MCASIVSTLNTQGGEVTVRHKTGFSFSNGGIYQLIKADKTDKEVKDVFISSPVWLEKAIEDAGSGEVSIVVAGINKLTDRLFSFPVKREGLLPSPNNVVLRQLANHGVDFDYGQSKHLLSFLAGNKPSVIKGFSQVGWTKVAGRRVFVLPKLVIGAVAGHTYQFMPLSDSTIHRALSERGTLAEWQQEVASATIGNPLVLFLLGVAFLAPLLELLDMEGGILLIYAVTSTGKTALLQLCASVYGNGADPATNPQSMIQSWHMTNNAIEAIATDHNDLPMCMDELGLHGGSLAQLAYGLSNGTEKKTMTQYRDLRPTRSWKTQVISTGEVSYSASILEATKKQARAGQMIRAIELPVDVGIYPSWPEAERGERVTKFKNATGHYYGMAKIPYLQYLVEIANDPVRLNDLKSSLESWRKVLLESVGDKLDSPQERTAKRFAAVALALTLARDAKVITPKDEDIKKAMVSTFRLWLGNSVTVSEAENGLEQLKHTVQSNPSRFGNALATKQIGTGLLGYRDDDEKFYIIPIQNMAELTGRSNYSPVVTLLKKMGMLSMNNTNNDGSSRPSKRVKLGTGEYVTAYVISFQLFTFDEETEAWLESLLGMSAQA